MRQKETTERQREIQRKRYRDCQRERTGERQSGRCGAIWRDRARESGQREPYRYRAREKET